MTGTIIRLLAKKQFGFIKGEDRLEYFFHREDFNGHWADLIENFDNGIEVKVQFKNSRTHKGPRAEMVSELDNDNVTGLIE